MYNNTNATERGFFGDDLKKRGARYFGGFKLKKYDFMKFWGYFGRGFLATCGARRKAINNDPAIPKGLCPRKISCAPKLHEFNSFWGYFGRGCRSDVPLGGTPGLARQTVGNARYRPQRVNDGQDNCRPLYNSL